MAEKRDSSSVRLQPYMARDARFLLAHYKYGESKTYEASDIHSNKRDFIH